MWIWINRWLDQPWKRLLFLLAGAALFLLLLRISAGTVWRVRLIALIPGGIALLLMRRSLHAWANLRRQLMRREMRMVKAWRTLARRSPVIQVLQVFSVSLGFGSVVLVVFGYQLLADVTMHATLGVLALAGFIDAVALTSRLLKHTWMAAVGKMLSLTLCVAMAAVSLALAKSVTHTLTHIDPKYLGEFTLVVTCCMLPFVYLVLVSAVLFAAALCQLAVLMALVMGNMLAQPFLPLTGLRWQNSIKLYWFRLRHGKRPSGAAMPAPGFMPPQEISLIVAPVSKLALGAVIWFAVQFFVSGFTIVVPTLGKVLVFLEYRPQSGCTNLRADAAVAYMEDGYVSVAVATSTGYDFVTMKCEL